MATKVLDVPILIIGFQRVNSLETLINLCLRETKAKIFISMDGPPTNKIELVNESRRLVEDFKAAYPDRIALRLLADNVGSAVNVITALDWFFSNNINGVVLEDDCIPHKDFFKYSVRALDFIENYDSIWSFSGFRPLLKEIDEIQYSLCALPLNWGWGTTREKWIEIRRLLTEQRVENIFLSFLFGPSRVYWNIGYRRIINGWVDAWDTAVAFLMIRENKFALLPNCNLVSNVGNDKFALNTKKETVFLNSTTVSWNRMKISVDPKNFPVVNRSIYKKMVGIRRVHIILPILKYAIQKIFKFHNNYGFLSLRLEIFNSKGLTPYDN
jgi:hypothetical protein